MVEQLFQVVETATLPFKFVLSSASHMLFEALSEVNTKTIVFFDMKGWRISEDGWTSKKKREKKKGKSVSVHVDILNGKEMNSQ